MEGGESGDSVDGAPGGRARPQYIGLTGARWLAVGDRVVQKVPVGNRRQLQSRVVGFGHERSVGEVVDMRAVTDERDVRIREGVQPGTGVRFSGGHGVCGLIGRLLQPHARDSGQEPSLVAKVDVWGLVTHPDGLCHAAQAEAFRGFVRQRVEGGVEKFVVQTGAGSGVTGDWPERPPCSLDSVNHPEEHSG